MTALGEYLRSRRALVRPHEVGLPVSGRRRVSGLRREEVALLAGVSADYYVRLEQGRERHPSVSVLDALADVLGLRGDARRHLFDLAGPVPRTPATPEHVDPQLRALLDAWPDQPALVLGRAYDVLAANRLGAALFGLPPNLAYKVFLDPAARTFYADWGVVAAGTVAGLRVLHGATPGDPRIRAVVAELTAHSPEFAELWRRHDAHGKTAETKHLVHPEVGPLELHMQTFDVRSAPGQQLVVYHADPGSPTARNLTLLGTLAATTAQEAR